MGIIKIIMIGIILNPGSEVIKDFKKVKRKIVERIENKRRENLS